MKLSQRDLDRLVGVNPSLILILKEASIDSPYEFHIPLDGGVRTALRQNQLFLAGKSKRDGYKKIGKHQSGKAFDIFLMIDKKASWDKPALKATMYHIKKIAMDKFNVKLNLGCDWVEPVDYPHGELL